MASKNTASIKARRKKVLIKHMQDRPSRMRSQGSLTSSTHQRRGHDRPRYRPTQKRQSRLADTRGANAEMIKPPHQKSPNTCATTVQQNHQPKRRTTTELAFRIKVISWCGDPSSPSDCRPLRDGPLVHVPTSQTESRHRIQLLDSARRRSHAERQSCMQQDVRQQEGCSQFSCWPRLEWI